jgi:RNA polymerase-binding transcription factor DksA
MRVAAVFGAIVRAIPVSHPLSFRAGDILAKEEGMNSVNRTVLDTLGREERELRCRISTLRRRHAHSPGMSYVPTEAPSDVAERALKLSAGQHDEIVRGRLADKGRQLANALECLRDGTYGICQACGRRIPRRRLEAMPRPPCASPARSSARARRLREASHPAPGVMVPSGHDS